MGLLLHYLFFTYTLLIVISSCTIQANAEGQKWVCFSIGII